MWKRYQKVNLNELLSQQKYPNMNEIYAFSSTAPESCSALTSNAHLVLVADKASKGKIPKQNESV